MTEQFTAAQIEYLGDWSRWSNSSGQEAGRLYKEEAGLFEKFTDAQNKYFKSTDAVGIFRRENPKDKIGLSKLKAESNACYSKQDFLGKEYQAARARRVAFEESYAREDALREARFKELGADSTLLTLRAFAKEKQFTGDTATRFIDRLKKFVSNRGEKLAPTTPGHPARKGRRAVAAKFSRVYLEEIYKNMNHERGI